MVGWQFLQAGSPPMAELNDVLEKTPGRYRSRYRLPRSTVIYLTRNEGQSPRALLFRLRGLLAVPTIQLFRDEP